MEWLTFGRSIAAIATAFLGAMWWVFKVSQTAKEAKEKAEEAKEIAVQADKKADAGRERHHELEVNLTRLNGCLDVTNANMASLNNNIERLLQDKD